VNESFLSIQEPVPAKAPVFKEMPATDITKFIIDVRSVVTPCFVNLTPILFI